MSCAVCGARRVSPRRRRVLVDPEVCDSRRRIVAHRARGRPGRPIRSSVQATNIAALHHSAAVNILVIEPIRNSVRGPGGDIGTAGTLQTSTADGPRGGPRPPARARARRLSTPGEPLQRQPADDASVGNTAPFGSRRTCRAGLSRRVAQQPSSSTRQYPCSRPSSRITGTRSRTLPEAGQRLRRPPATARPVAAATAPWPVCDVA
jgi:hypothetical protein